MDDEDEVVVSQSVISYIKISKKIMGKSGAREKFKVLTK
jgi:hypothetical protein